MRRSGCRGWPGRRQEVRRRQAPLASWRFAGYRRPGIRRERAKPNPADGTASETDDAHFANTDEWKRKCTDLTRQGSSGAALLHQRPRCGPRRRIIMPSRDASFAVAPSLRRTAQDRHRRLVVIVERFLNSRSADRRQLLADALSPARYRPATPQPSSCRQPQERKPNVRRTMPRPDDDVGSRQKQRNERGARLRQELPRPDDSTTIDTSTASHDTRHYAAAIARKAFAYVQIERQTPARLVRLADLPDVDAAESVRRADFTPRVAGVRSASTLSMALACSRWAGVSAR